MRSDRPQIGQDWKKCTGDLLRTRVRYRNDTPQPPPDKSTGGARQHQDRPGAGKLACVCADRLHCGGPSNPFLPSGSR